MRCRRGGSLSLRRARVRSGPRNGGARTRLRFTETLLICCISTSARASPARRLTVCMPPIRHELDPTSATSRIDEAAMNDPIASRAALADKRAQPLLAGSPVSMTFRVNGTMHDLTLDTRVSLLDALRDHLNLTGT